MGIKTLYEYFYKLAYGDKGTEVHQAYVDNLDVADAQIEANKNPYTNMVKCSDYNNPDDAITAIASANKTLLVTEAETCDTNFTVPANVTVKFERGGKWTINTGITVTFNGKIEASLFEIFSYIGTGTLNFGAEATEKVYPQWWGAIANGTIDCSPAIINAILSLPSVGGMVYLVAGTYRCNSSITFPIDTGYIKNIRIQGESSGLASGATANVLGTRINSYIAGGMLFDLYTDTPTCTNVQFRDFECQDIEGTGENYGIKAYIFLTSCIVENVGFKNFTTSIKITNFCYYSKFDRVSSFYARGVGMYIEGTNGVLFNRIQCSNSGGAGLYLGATTTHLRGVTVLNSWFEGNTGSGITVVTAANYKAYAINIIGCYFENNGAVTHDSNINITGNNVTDAVIGGSIIGNYFDATANSTSIILGYVYDILVQGNSLFAYYNNRCIYSANCVDCNFISNAYNSTPTAPLDVPADNYYIEPSLDKTKLPKMTSPIDLTSGQIIFPATQVPSAGVNTLDDYKEGEWTGTLVCGTSGTITLKAAYNTGAYVKIGRMVTVTGDFAVESVSSPVGKLTLGTLPFTSGTGSKFVSGANVYASGLETTAITQIQGQVYTGQVTMEISKFQAGVIANLAGDVKANSYFRISVTYFTD